MAKKINGITIAIDADTSGVTSGLKNLTSESVALSKQLKTVDSLLKLDPTNTELLDTKQKLLSQSIETSRKKLEALKAAQEDVKKAVASGSIGTEEYIAFQRELVQTEKRMKDLETQSDDTSESEQELTNQTKSTGDSMQDTEGKTAKLASALKTGIVAAAKAAAAALAAAGAAAVALAKSVIESTGELEQNLGGSESVFGEYAESMQKAGEEAYKNLGISQSEYLATANKMGALLQGSGFSAEQSAKMTEQAMQRAGDMASVMGIDMSSAMEAVAGAAKGNFTMMDNLGVAINDTTLKAYAASHGLGELESTQDKVNAAMQMFMETTEQYDGNFAREATETISGSFGLLSASWQSMIAGIGNSEADIRNLAGNVIDALRAVIDNVKPVLYSIVEALPEIADQLVSAVNDILPDLMPVVFKLVSSIADIADKIVPQMISAITKNLPKLVKVATKMLSTLASAILKNLPQILTAAIEIVKYLASELVKHLPELLKSAMELIKFLADSIVKELPALIETALAIITELATGLAEALPTLIPTIVSVMLKIVEILTNPDTLSNLIDAAVILITALADGLIAALPTLLDEAPVIIENLVDAIVDNLPKLLTAAAKIVIKLAQAIVENLPKLAGSAGKIIGKLVSGIIACLSKIGEAASEIIGEIKEKLSGEKVLENIKQWGKDIVDNFIEGFKSQFGEMEQALEDFGEMIYDFLHHTEPEKGPLKNDSEWGTDFMGNWITGIRGKIPALQKTVRDAAGCIRAGISLDTGGISGGTQRVSGAPAGLGGLTVGAINVNVTGAEGISNIGNTIVQKIDEALRKYQIQQARGQGGTGW